MSDQPRTFPWGASLLALLAFSIAGYAVAVYLTGRPLASGFLQGKGAYQGFQPTPTWTLALVLHAAGGSLALVTGALQWLRLKALRGLHPALGLTYALSILVAGLAGLVMAPVAMGGWVSALGFLALDVAWLGTTARAAALGWQLGRPGADRVALRARHRAWMVRSYALTAAAITLRLWMPLLALAGLEFVSAYVIIAWLCWVPNLVVAEILVRRSPSGRPLPSQRPHS